MHTPGPWTVRPGGGRHKVMGNGMQIWSASVHVASVTNKADKPMDQKVADAHLIAAAPKLLDALEDLIAAWPSDSLPPHRIAMKVAYAINGAKGQPIPADLPPGHA